MASPALHRKLADLQLPTSLELAVRELINAVDAQRQGAPIFVEQHLEKAGRHLGKLEAQAEEEAAA